MKQQSWYTHIVVDSRGFCRKSYVPTNILLHIGFSCETFFAENVIAANQNQSKMRYCKGTEFSDRSKINCCFLTGVVRCSWDNNAPVENAVVFAIRQSDGKFFQE